MRHLLSDHRPNPLSRPRLMLAVALLVIAALLAGCAPRATEPKYYQVFDLYGSPYERGFQHGQRFRSKIRSLYTMLLTNSIYPYLERDRYDVASVMLRYQNEEMYGNGQFSPRMMLECGYEFLKFMPQEYVDEMQGIADGAELPFDEILILNTFFDTLMGFRSITFFIKLIQGPWLLTVSFDGALNADGKDNDGDGEIDEPGEERQDPYEPRSYATMVEVPLDAPVKFILDDDKEGVNPESIRIQYNDRLFLADDPEVQTRPYAREGKTIEVTFLPPDGWPEASSVSINLQCTDLLEVVRVPPNHPRTMRAERITFTTAGYGKKSHQVPNQGFNDGRSQPPSLAFAVRGSATRDGRVIVAHNFAMLDSNITHKHVTMFVHHPDQGRSFSVLGYPGVIWGFSGMNDHGLTALYNASDTLNTPFAASFNEGLIFAKFKPTGVTAGVMLRELLNKYDNVEDALPYFYEHQASYGWNFLLADPSGEMKVVEVDSDITERAEGGVHVYGNDMDNPDDQDAWGKPLATVAGDDLYVASHYQKNLEEIRYQIVNFDLQPQRYWTTFYFRSLRAFFCTADALRARYGKLDIARTIDMLRLIDLKDVRDSMNSAVYDPGDLTVWVGAGMVPAPDAEFEETDLGEKWSEGGAP